MLASQEGHTEIASSLLENGADKDFAADGETAMLIASTAGHPGIVRCCWMQVLS